MPPLHIATFAADATPPLGHPLCGGWITPVVGVEDPLQARGVVLMGAGEPIVLCALDWVGLRNDAHMAWRRKLARAAHTTPDRVAIQCVHPHDSPFVDPAAQKILEATPGLSGCMDRGFFDQTIARVSGAIATAMARAQQWTHLGIGRGAVAKVASNRRVLGPDAKVQYWRGSSTTNATAREQPEGLIDPDVRTVSFWNQEKPIAAMHYYATHPMSHYGKGRVSCDFCGLARDKLQSETPDTFQIYFTGCAGNIAAGKYNDGAPENRAILRDRVHAGLKVSWESTKRHAVKDYTWRSQPVILPPRTEASFSETESLKELQDPKRAKGRRGNAAFQLSWLARKSEPIELSCLDFGPASLVHLPGEPFIEYQLALQKEKPRATVCVAGYGDGGPGYLPTAKAYGEGGYEITVALAGPQLEDIVLGACRKLLG